MKKILTIIIALAFCYTASAQIVFSDNRPESPVVVHQLQSQVDTVYVLTEAGIEKAVMVIPLYEIIYEKTGEHEGDQFQGLPEFFVVDEKGYYANRVKPVGYYKTWGSIVSSDPVWYNRIGINGILTTN